MEAAAEHVRLLTAMFYSDPNWRAHIHLGQMHIISFVCDFVAVLAPKVARFTDDRDTDRADCD